MRTKRKKQFIEIQRNYLRFTTQIFNSNIRLYINTSLNRSWSGLTTATLVNFYAILLTISQNCSSGCGIRNWYRLWCFAFDTSEWFKELTTSTIMSRSESDFNKTIYNGCCHVAARTVVQMIKCGTIVNFSTTISRASQRYTICA